MWVRDHSLRELQTLLYGYGVALLIHEVDEHFAFGPRGPFSDWLEQAVRMVAGARVGCGDRRSCRR